jgi:hypothetical protein
MMMIEATGPSQMTMMINNRVEFVQLRQWIEGESDIIKSFSERGAGECRIHCGQMATILELDEGPVSCQGHGRARQNFMKIFTRC